MTIFVGGWHLLADEIQGYRKKPTRKDQSDGLEILMKHQPKKLEMYLSEELYKEFDEQMEEFWKSKRQQKQTSD